MELSMKVSAFKEVPGPLGGSTIEYEVQVSTNIPQLIECDAQCDSTTFTVGKTFREIEDFQAKVFRKLPKGVTNIGKEKLMSEDTEERRIFADKFFSSITEMQPQCLPLFQEFFDCEHVETKPGSATKLRESSSKDNFDIFEEVREIAHIPDAKTTKGSSSGSLFDKEDVLFSNPVDSSASVCTPSFENSLLSPTDSPFFFAPSTYKEKEGSLHEGRPDQEMTEIKNIVRHSSVNSPGEPDSAIDEIQLLSVDDDISELMEALQRKQERPTPKPKPTPRPLCLTGAGRPVPLPRMSLQSKSTPDEANNCEECLTDAFNTSDILKYIEREGNAKDAAEPTLF